MVVRDTRFARARLLKRVLTLGVKEKYPDNGKSNCEFAISKGLMRGIDPVLTWILTMSYLNV